MPFFLQKSSCVWPMLAADPLWRVVCSKLRPDDGLIKRPKQL
jgi:hypothetical protein